MFVWPLLAIVYYRRGLWGTAWALDCLCSFTSAELVVTGLLRRK